ncbi:MAG TPA: hypothetical protein VG710_11805 [Opitutus sp.]|nr:hypothetical protein [Opitutus sp.]
MHGETIIVRSISATRIEDRHGNLWQYHSRSDRHSKIACWAILFDLLRTCPLLRQHVEKDKVAFGVNHQMRDFKQNKKKNLDLVLSGHRDESEATFVDFASKWGVVLDDREAEILASLPVLRKAAVASVFMALEAKACMTEHIKAIPRLNDELSSSFQTIHGDTGSAIAGGFVMINCADSFISSDRHPKKVRAGKYTITNHRQPHVAERVVEAVMKIPRRSDHAGHGFDAVGITMVHCRNDGTEVMIDESANARVPEIARYSTLIERLGHLYATKYSGI